MLQDLISLQQMFRAGQSGAVTVDWVIIGAYENARVHERKKAN